jgi:hypothetical protein
VRGQHGDFAKLGVVETCMRESALKVRKRIEEVRATYEILVKERSKSGQ